METKILYSLPTVYYYAAKGMKYRTIKEPVTKGNISLDYVVAVARALNNQESETKNGSLKLIDSLVLNRKRPESLTKQMTNQISCLIEIGLLKKGTSLPPVGELAKSLKVSQSVVREGTGS